MYVACSSVCFSHCTLDEALKKIHELRFSKVDLFLGETHSHVSMQDILTDVNRAAVLLKSKNMLFSSFHLDLPMGDLDKPREQLKAICRLARLMTVPLISIPAAPFGTDFDAEIRRLQQYNRIAIAEGITLSVTTDHRTLTADQLGAAELCKRVPGLRLALDPSHYLFGEHGTDDFDVVYPHVSHVRVHDSRCDAIQVRVGQGSLEYTKLITQLQRYRYDRALSVDIRSVPDQDFAMEPEVRKLKYLLESMI